MNPLHPEGWFALGYCALKQRDFARAAQAFSRCAQQQPDNGDAWNNLAAIHLQASTPYLAHSVYILLGVANDIMGPAEARSTVCS